MLEDLLWSLSAILSSSQPACELAYEHDAMDVISDLIMDIEHVSRFIRIPLRILIAVVSGRPIKEDQLVHTKVITKTLRLNNPAASAVALDLLDLFIETDYNQWYISNYDGLVPLLLTILQTGLNTPEITAADGDDYLVFLNAVKVCVALVSPAKVMRREHFELPRIATRLPPVRMMVSSGVVRTLILALATFDDRTLHEDVVPRMGLLFNGVPEVIALMLNYGAIEAAIQAVLRTKVDSSRSEMLGWLLDVVQLSDTPDLDRLLELPHFLTLFSNGLIEYMYMDETPGNLRRVLNCGAKYGRLNSDHSSEEGPENPLLEYLHSTLVTILEYESAREPLATEMLEILEQARIGTCFLNDDDSV